LRLFCSQARIRSQSSQLSSSRVSRVIKGATQLRASQYRGTTTSLQFFPEKSIRISRPKQRSTGLDVTKKDVLLLLRNMHPLSTL
jgi:hypothetical protein